MRGCSGTFAGGRREPSDFIITYTDDSWTWAGETRPGLPILHFPDRSVCEPVMTYFGYSAEIARVVPSSMRVEAYAIREFFCFLANLGLNWDQADDRTLRGWRQQQKTSVAKIDERSRSESGCIAPLKSVTRKVIRPSPHQIERKIVFVLEFYRLLPEAMCLDLHGRPWPAFVGSARSRKSYAITTKALKVMTPFGPRTVIRWIGAARLPAGRVRRAPLSQEVVGRILARLRSTAMVEPTSRPTLSADVQSRQKAELNWLEARCEAEAGLRSEEVVKLTVSAISKALAEEGVGRGLGGLGARPEDLLHSVLDEESRDSITAGLEDLAAFGRSEIGVEVTCKGRTRNAPFPISLVSDLLRIGLWTVRIAQVRNWTEQQPGYVAPDELFLSFKTGRGLTVGALGDTMKAALKAEGVLGGGHRLRAFFGTELAHRLLQLRLSLNGYRYDPSVEQWVLQHVAEAMGHAQPSTTVAFYVDRALMRIVGAPSETVLAGMINVHRALLANAGTLTEDDFSRVLRSVLKPFGPTSGRSTAANPAIDGSPSRGAGLPGSNRIEPISCFSDLPRSADVRRQAMQLLRRRKIAASPKRQHRKACQYAKEAYIG